MRGFRRWLTTVWGLGILVACAAVLILGIVYEFDRQAKGLPPPIYPSKGQLPDPQRTGGPPTVWAVTLLAGLAYGAFRFLRQTLPRGPDRPPIRPVSYILSCWVFVLEPGERYDRALSSLAEAGDMARSSGRRFAAQRFAATILPEDVLDGFAAFPASSPYGPRLGRRAEALLDDLGAVVARSAGPEDGDVCLAICVATDLSVARPPADATPDRLVRALRISCAGSPGDDAVFFVRHRGLRREDTAKVVAALRARVLTDDGTKRAS